MTNMFFDPRWEGASIPDNQWHFHKRLLERYGIVLGPGEYSQIKYKMTSAHAAVVAQTPNTITYRVVLEREEEGAKKKIAIKVMVRKEGKVLGRFLTALPLDRVRGSSARRVG